MIIVYGKIIMKKISIVAMGLAFGTLLYAECSNMPVGMALSKSIEAKEVSKAKELLVQYKSEVKKYLENCDKSKEKFEETSVMIHTYEAKLLDLEYDLKKVAHTTDCSKVPSSTSLEDALKSNNVKTIESLYAQYKKDAEAYIENCASHVEYETVYETVMFCDEMYDEWKEKLKK